ncbi:TolC family protein [bacterium]|nr:TolC family protein [bacterium]
MNMKNLLCTAGIILLFFSANTLTLAIEDEAELFDKNVEIHNGSVLNIIDCVSLAFRNSPKIRRQKYNLDIAKSNVGIAKSQYFPVISAGVGFYNENNSNNIYYDSHYRDLPSVGVSVNKLVWNFGKTTAYIKMEEFYKIGAEYEFMDSLCMTLFDIKAKYYALLKAKALLNVAKNNEKLNEKFVKLAQNKGEADSTTAQVNLSEAKIKYIEAENTFNNARVDLSNSMYLDNQPNYDIENTQTFTYNDDYAYDSKRVETKPFEPYIFPFERAKAIDIAYENSPDLQVLIATKNAMIQSLKYVKRTYLPDLNASAGYGYNNTNFAHNNSLQVGVNLSSNVNLMELKHSIKGADAQVNLADNEVLLFKKDLYFELQRAFNNVDRAQKQVPASKKEVEQALDNLKIVEKGYNNSKLNYVALQEAKDEYIRALENYVKSVYNYNIALIQVEMAMHYHLIDIHHKSEHAVHYHFEEILEHLNKVLDCDEKEVRKNR